MVTKEDRVQALVGILGKEVEDVTALAEKRQERIADLKRENESLRELVRYMEPWIESDGVRKLVLRKMRDMGIEVYEK